MIYYRSAQTTDLTAGQVDSNFRTLSEGLAAAQSGGATVVDLVIEGSSMTLVFSDSSTLGPFELPGFDDAPNNGNSYVRKNSDWSVITAGELGQAEADGQIYGSRNGAWTPFLPGIEEAPETGGPFARQGNDWVVVTSGGSSGGLRHLGDWSGALNIAKHDLVEHNSMTWLARNDWGTGSVEPSMSNLLYWRAIGFPTSDLYEMTSNQLYHRFATADRSDTVSLWEIFNDLHTRVLALEYPNP